MSLEFLAMRFSKSCSAFVLKSWAFILESIVAVGPLV